MMTVALIEHRFLQEGTLELVLKMNRESGRGSRMGNSADVSRGRLHSGSWARSGLSGSQVALGGGVGARSREKAEAMGWRMNRRERIRFVL